MFQNIAEEKEEINTSNNGVDNKNDKIKKIITKNFTRQNILMYVLSLMISIVSGPNGMAPFGIAIFASCISNEIPAVMIFLMTLIGTGIGFGGSGVLTYVFTTLIFIAMILIFKPWYEEEYKSERRRLGRYVFAAVIIVQIVQMLLRGFLLYDLFLSITTGVVAYIFYKIFANSLTTISEFNIKEAFTVEEVIGASLILSIAVSCFGELSILGFEIRTVLSILIVLILGWKNGMLIGATSGITIGAVLGILGNRYGNHVSIICTLRANCRGAK